MKVFRIRFDADKYQVAGSCPRFLSDYPRTVAFDRWAPTWREYEFPVGPKSRKRGDFIGVLSHAYISSAKATEALHGCIGSDVETLPVKVTGDAGKYFLWNIVNYVDALDASTTRYENRPPSHLFPSHYGFLADQIARPMVFKVPKHPHVPLVATGFADESHDFFLRYHELKCRGLTFELLWESSPS